MIARLCRLASVAVLCVAAVGCSCGKYAGKRYACGNGECGPGCWAPHGACGQIAGGCDSQSAEGCGCEVAGGCAEQQGSFRGRLLGALGGCSGCSGEIYWSEWHNDPPCCEPCDCCGNFTGSNCCTSGYCSTPGCAVAGGIALDGQEQSQLSGTDAVIDAVSFSEERFVPDAEFEAYEAEFVDDEETPMR